MRKRIYSLGLMFFILCSFVFAAPKYKVQSLDILASIQKDGSVIVQEMALYDAAQINGILYDIDAKGYGELYNLEVYIEEDGQFKPAVRQRGSAAGSYTVSESDGLYKIKLYSPMKNERRYFIFSYMLPKGVSVYEDTAQFNRKMVGRGWSSNIDKISVKIELPSDVPKDKINAFGHGPLTGNIEILSGREILYTLNKYKRGEFVETNILFPKEILTEFNKNNIIKRKAYDDIMAMERGLAEEANEERAQAVRTMIFVNAIFFGAIVWWALVMAFVYSKNKKRHKVEAPYGEYFRELPDDYSPAVAGTLVSRKLYPSPEHLFATVLDLVRKDYLEMEEIPVESSGIFKKNRSKTILKRIKTDTAELKDYEKMVLEWYIDRLGDGEKVVLEEVEKCVSKSSNAKIFYADYEKWKTLVYSDMLSKGLKMDKRNVIASGLGMITGLAMFAGGGILTGMTGAPRFILLTILGFPTLIFTLTARRPSKIKEEAYARWKAFKNFLVDYSNLEEAKLASIHIWEHYFVYAVALGVAEKVAEGYKKIALARGDETTYIRTMRRTSLMNMYMYNRAFKRIERSTVTAVNRSISEVSKSNRSSYSGSGGGFSGGSSGGGGGRGGGGAF